MSGSASCPPHDQQKGLLPETSARQCGQVRASGAPHSSQNLALSGFVAWHRGHRIAGTSCQRKHNRDVGGAKEYTDRHRRNRSAGSSDGNRSQFRFFMQVLSHMDDAFATMEQNALRNGSGNLTIFTAIRRASSLLSDFATVR